MGKVLIDNISANEEAWIAQKIHSIGSGDIPTIVGVNKYQTPLKLWAVKTRREAPEAENDHMWWGKQQEASIAALCAKRMNLRIQHGNRLYGHDEFEWATATPDYFAYDGNDLDVEPIAAMERRILECKNVSFRAGKDWENETPLAPRIQTMWQMGIVGDVKKAIIAPLIGGDIFDFAPREVEFSKLVFEQLLELAAQFMWYIKNDKPPPPKAQDTKLVDKIIGALEEKSVELDPALAAEVNLYLAYNEALKLKQGAADFQRELLDEVKNKLRLAMGNAKSATCGGHVLKVTEVVVQPFFNKGNKHTRFTIK